MRTELSHLYGKRAAFVGKFEIHSVTGNTLFSPVFVLNGHKAEFIDHLWVYTGSQYIYHGIGVYEGNVEYYIRSDNSYDYTFSDITMLERDKYQELFEDENDAEIDEEYIPRNMESRIDEKALNKNLKIINDFENNSLKEKNISVSVHGGLSENQAKSYGYGNYMSKQFRAAGRKRDLDIKRKKYMRKHSIMENTEVSA